MLNVIHLLNYALPFLYLITFSLYLYDYLKDKYNLEIYKRGAVFTTIIIHCGYLAIRTFEYNYPPITNKYEIFTMLALAVTWAYFLVELISNIRVTGVFIIPFSIFFQVISTLCIADIYQVKEVLHNFLLGFHVVSAILGYAGFTLSAVYGILFLILYKKIKKNNFGLIFKRVPSLETLEQLSFYSVVIGFLFLTISILVGLIWLPNAFPDVNYNDPKLILSGLVWIIYAIGIIAKFFGKWYGKKVIITTLIGFAVIFFSLLLINLLGTSFHSFS